MKASSTRRYPTMQPNDRTERTSHHRVPTMMVQKFKKKNVVAGDVASVAVSSIAFVSRSLLLLLYWIDWLGTGWTIVVSVCARNRIRCFVNYDIASDEFFFCSFTVLQLPHNNNKKTNGKKYAPDNICLVHSI